MNESPLPRIRAPESLRSTRWFGPADLRSFGHRSRAMQMGWSEEDWKGKPWFKLLPPENGPAGSEDTGDGTVPFRGACPGFLPKERLVGVTRSDLSMWEVGDQALLRSVGLHGTLANVNLVQRLAIKHLRSDFSADFWGHPVPGVQKPQWPKWIEVRPLE